MSVDNKIVKMQFDNAQFEAGVMKSMKTIDQLNEKLQFKEAAGGISSLMVAVEGISSKSVSSAIRALDKVSDYTTTVLGMMAQKIKTQFADKIVQAIESIPTKAMNQIKTGGWTRAMNLANAQFQIEGLKYSWDKVYDAADYAVTDTAYGLDSAAKAASQLAASGVDFEKVIGKDGAGKDLTQMHKSLRAISGVAAMTNSSYDDIAHTFTRIAGQGRVMGEDLNSLASRGLNAAATLAKSLGTTEAEIRDMVSKGSIDFAMFSEAMDEAYGDHAKEANKTFTGSLSNMKAALSRIGAIFTQPVIDKTNTFFVSVTNRIKEFQNALKDVTNADGTKTVRFAGHFAEAWESGVQAASKFVESINLDWFSKVASALDNLAINAKTVFDGVTAWFDKTKTAADKIAGVAEVAKLTADDLKFVEATIRGDYGTMEARWAKLDKLTGGRSKQIQAYVDQAAKVGYNLEELGWTVEELTKETKDASTQATSMGKKMSVSEVLAKRLSMSIANVFNILKYGKEIVTNVAKNITDFFKGITQTANEATSGFLIISTSIATLAHSLSSFTKVARPSETIINAIDDALGTVAYDLKIFSRRIIGTTTDIINFAATVLRSKETLEELAAKDNLTPLQASVLSVMRVMKNLGIVVGTLAASLYKVIKAIVKGLTKAFNPSGVLSGVADFSEGLANLTEKFKITDEAASGIEKVFEGIGKVILTIVSSISKAIGGFTKFVTSLGKTKKELSSTSKEIKSVDKNGKETVSIFDKMKETFTKVLETLKKIPDKFQELKDAVNEQEGVQRLKTSFETLKESIKASLSEFHPFTKEIEDVSEAAGGTGETFIGKLASAIGIVSGKIADFIDVLPTWGENIEKFFNNVKTTIDNWITNLHLSTLFENIGKGVTEFFESDESIFVKIKKFADRVFTAVTESLENIDWSKVEKGSILALVAANLFKFFKVGSNLESLIGNVASIPKDISGIFKNLGNVFTTAEKSMTKLTNAYIFSSVISSVLILVSAVSLLGEMDPSKLEQGIAAITWLGLIMAAIAKALGGTKYVNKQQIQEIDNSQKNMLQINNSISGLIGGGILLAGMGVAIWAVAQAIVSIGKEMAANKDGVKAAFGQIILICLTIAASFGVIAFISNRLAGGAKGIGKLSALFGVGTLIAGFGAAVYLIAQAIIKLAKEFSGIDWKQSLYAGGTILIISAVLIGFVYVAEKFAKKLNWKPLLVMGVTLFLFTAAIAIVTVEILGLTALLTQFPNLFEPGAVMFALGIIVSIILSLSLMVYLMGKGLEDVSKPGALIGVVFMMGVFVLAIAGAIAIIVKTISDGVIGPNSVSVMELAVIAMVGIILAIGIAVAAIMAFASKKFQGMERVQQTLLSIGGLFVMVGAMALMVAVAATLISGASVGSIIAIGVFMVAVGAVLIWISKTAVKAGGNGKEIEKALFSVAIAFVGIAASLYIFAKAMEVLQGVNWSEIWLPLTILGVLMVALIALTAILGSKSGAGDGMLKVAGAIALIGATFLLAGAGLMLAAKAIESIVSLSTDLIGFIVGVGAALAEHPAIIIAVIVALVAVVAVVYLITKNIGPVVNVICQAIALVVNAISTAVSAIGSSLKTGGANLSKWWKNLQPQLKIGIVSGIITLCSAILSASPEVLKTVGSLITKLIDFLIDIIPTVVDGLVRIILRLINSLADSIRKNSAKIAYAVWNVVEALLEILADVIGEGLALIFGKIPGFGDAILESTADLKQALRGNLASLKQYADDIESKIEIETGLDTSMNKITKDLQNQAKAYNTSADLAQKNGEAAAKAANEAEKGTESANKSLLNWKDNLSSIGLSSSNNWSDIVSGDSFSSLTESIPIDGIDIDSINMESMDQNVQMFDNVQAFDAGESIPNDVCAGITSPESQEKYQDAADENVTIYANQLSSKENKQKAADSAGKVINATIGQMNNPSTIARFKNASDRWAQASAEGYYTSFLDYINDLKKPIAKTGDDINKAFCSKDGIDAHSPSRKFYKSGMYCVLGIQQALKENEDLAVGQTTHMGAAMVNAMGSSLDYVGKIASGELEYDPRVRPVMDLSRVGNAASDVNSMFTHQNVTLSGLTGEIAYDMTSLNGSNAAVVSELQALRDDMNIMTDELTNMQIVMDTGALVGSTVGAYDEAFGRRAVYGGRGN